MEELYWVIFVMFLKKGIIPSSPHLSPSLFLSFPPSFAPLFFFLWDFPNVYTFLLEGKGKLL